MMIYSTKTGAEVARSIIRRLPGAVMGRMSAGRFKDGEQYVSVKDVPKARIALVSATGPGDEPLVSTLLSLDALKVAHAKKIFLVLTYAGFARQDESRDMRGMAARMIPRLLKVSGAHTLVVLDPHSTATTKAVPHVVVVSALPVLAEALKSFSKGAVVVAPDRGARQRAMQLAALLGGLPTAYILKTRPTPEVAVARNITGTSVHGKTVILIDDIIDTGGTMVAAAGLVRKAGAIKVVAAATHGIFTGTAIGDIGSVCAAIVVTNSIARPEAKRVRVVDCAIPLARTLRTHAR